MRVILSFLIRILQAMIRTAAKSRLNSSRLNNRPTRRLNLSPTRRLSHSLKRCCRITQNLFGRCAYRFTNIFSYCKKKGLIPVRWVSGLSFLFFRYPSLSGFYIHRPITQNIHTPMKVRLALLQNQPCRAANSGVATQRSKHKPGFTVRKKRFLLKRFFNKRKQNIPCSGYAPANYNYGRIDNHR